MNPILTPEKIKMKKRALHICLPASGFEASRLSGRFITHSPIHAFIITVLSVIGTNFLDFLQAICSNFTMTSCIQELKLKLKEYAMPTQFS